MSTLMKQKNFEEIYNKTYNNVLKYIVCKCQNLDDVNELVQDTYVELYQMLKNRKQIKNEKSYVLGIAKNIVKKYYRNKYKEKSNILYFSKDREQDEIEIQADVNLEADFISKENIEEIWNYLRSRNFLYYPEIIGKIDCT